MAYEYDGDGLHQCMVLYHQDRLEFLLTALAIPPASPGTGTIPGDVLGI